MMRKTLLPVLVAALTLAGCAAGEPTTSEDEVINVTGSATVEPITSYLAGQSAHAVDISADGTLDGFEEFCQGNSDLNGASVSITAEFIQQCADNGVEYVEAPIALDAVTIVKNRANTFSDDLTLDQLRDMWSADSAVETWSEIAPGWPDESISFYGRPDGSGTRDYLENVLLDDGEMREDVTTTDDIDELSAWLADDDYGIGFMGAGNYLATSGDIRARIDNVQIEGVAPGVTETQRGDYPLARPLFLYINAASLDKDAVQDFAANYLAEVEAILPRVYFYQLPEEEYENARERLTERTLGPDERWSS